MNSAYHGSVGLAVACIFGIVCPSAAIEVNPAQPQIQAALDRGKKAAAQHQPPEAFYARYGGTDDLHVGGFLITKLGGLSVLATHMALRGLEPSAADVAQVMEAPTMLVNTVIFGDSPSFAVNSYVVLDQGGRVIKPVTVRVDGQASRSAVWPKSPKFQAKVVAVFGYADFDPKALTTLTVFPATGGEVRFSLDFGQIE